jgi:hypothetical protein
MVLFVTAIGLAMMFAGVLAGALVTWLLGMPRQDPA